MSDVPQLTLGQQIWRMAERLALPLASPGIVRARPTLVALDAAPRLERRYETLAAPGLLSAQIAQRFAPQDAPAPGADMPLSIPPRPASAPAVARWSAQRWPDSPAAAAAADTPAMAVRRSAAAPARSAAQPVMPPSPFAPVARSADLADQRVEADPDGGASADAPLHSEPHAAPADALPSAVSQSAPSMAPVARMTSERPPMPAAGDEPPSSATPPAPDVGPALAERHPGVIPPPGPVARAADRPGAAAPGDGDVAEPDHTTGGVAAADLGRMQPAALRPTTLMRSMAPDPLARMGLAAPDRPLVARGAEPLPATDPAPAALPVARAPMRAAEQHPAAAPAPVAQRAPMPPAAPTADPPRALPAPGTVRRVPARRTSIAESADPSLAAGDAPTASGAPSQDGVVARTAGDQEGGLSIEPSGVGAPEQTGEFGDAASRAADPGDPVGAVADAAPPPQRSAGSPPGTDAQGDAAPAQIAAPGLPEPAALGAPPAIAAGGPGRGEGLPPVARQSADLPLVARLSDHATVTDTPEGGSMDLAALPAGPQIASPAAQRAPEIVAPAAQQPAGAAPGGALAALPLQRIAEPTLRHAAAPLAGLRAGAAPTLHDPSWRPAATPARSVAERLRDTPSDTAPVARDPALVSRAEPATDAASQHPLMAGWHSPDLPDAGATMDLRSGTVARRVAADLGAAPSDTLSIAGQTIGAGQLPLAPTLAGQIRRMQAESPLLARAFGIPQPDALSALDDAREAVGDRAGGLPDSLPDPSAPLELVRGPAAEAGRLLGAAQSAAAGIAGANPQSAAAGATGATGGAGQPSIEQIARQVYDHLRRQLLIDRERLGRL